MSQRETMDAPPVAYSFSSAFERLAELEAALGMAIRGKAEIVRLSLVCLLAKGHLLIEDVPGVGKTTLAQALARTVQSSFHRLQFTSDMLPSDVLGVTIYNAHTGEFEFKQGPVFTNFLLADEINRATPKTQSALLEAMNERQVTIDSRSYALSEPFMVIATQNPVEHHGTYPLPESQLDRFLMRLRMGYPDHAAERDIVRDMMRPPSEMTAVIAASEVVQLQSLVPGVRVDDALVDYMLAVVARTRAHESLSLGVSPRGAQALFRAAQALALVEGRDFVIPDDIKRLVPPVFAHRVVMNNRLGPLQRTHEMAERILGEILTFIDVPL
ncbi:MAG: MoxR family ATPase [Bryobacteraceae bacterium]|nr:MoxR family ATPase [Bryobacteraceae bacterium]